MGEEEGGDEGRRYDLRNSDAGIGPTRPSVAPVALEARGRGSSASTGDFACNRPIHPHPTPRDLALTCQAWTTSNLLRTQVELENQLANGLKLDLNTTLNPAKSQKAAILTAIYKQPSVHTRAVADVFKVSLLPPQPTSVQQRRLP